MNAPQPVAIGDHVHAGPAPAGDCPPGFTGTLRENVPHGADREPGAVLDGIRAAAFQQDLGAVPHGLESPRFGNARRAGRIVVPESCWITGDGSHEALIAADGRYAWMSGLQAVRFAAAGDGS